MSRRVGFDNSGKWAGAGVELLLDEREGVPAQHHGSVSEGDGRGIALVLEIGTETGGEVAHDLLTGGAQGLLDVIGPPPSLLGDKKTDVTMIAKR